VPLSNFDLVNMTGELFIKADLGLFQLFEDAFFLNLVLPYLDTLWILFRGLLLHSLSII